MRVFTICLLVLTLVVAVGLGWLGFYNLTHGHRTEAVINWVCVGVNLVSAFVLARALSRMPR